MQGHVFPEPTWQHSPDVGSTLCPDVDRAKRKSRIETRKAMEKNGVDIRAPCPAWPQVTQVCRPRGCRDGDSPLGAAGDAGDWVEHVWGLVGQSHHFMGRRRKPSLPAQTGTTLPGGKQADRPGPLLLGDQQCRATLLKTGFHRATC